MVVFAINKDSTMTPDQPLITQLLTDMNGEAPPKNIVDRLFELVYGELRHLAERALSSERSDHTLTPTALVHEAYVRLVDQNAVAVHGRTHFFGIAALAMRRILIDWARHKKAIKRGAGWHRVTLTGLEIEGGDLVADLLDLDRALTQLAEHDERMASAIQLRYFAGISLTEIGQLLGVTRRTVYNDLRLAEAWLRRELTEDSGVDP
jgi:RNA polymerase sigma factor (TIGR02999 family)